MKSLSQVQLVGTAILLAALSGCASTSRCVGFDGLAAGTEWGTPAGHASGEVVHSENDVAVSVEDFAWHTGGTFDSTRLYVPFSGTGNSMWTDNINLEFDFTGLPETPRRVFLMFQDKGGFENIAVNGSSAVVGDLAAGSSGAVSWNVYDTSVSGGREGMLVVNGPVSELQVGGQEFAIDWLCVCD